MYKCIDQSHKYYYGYKGQDLIEMKNSAFEMEEPDKEKEKTRKSRAKSKHS